MAAAAAAAAVASAALPRRTARQRLTHMRVTLMIWLSFIRTPRTANFFVFSFPARSRTLVEGREAVAADEASEDEKEDPASGL